MEKTQQMEECTNNRQVSDIFDFLWFHWSVAGNVFSVFYWTCVIFQLPQTETSQVLQRLWQDRQQWVKHPSWTKHSFLHFVLIHCSNTFCWSVFAFLRLVAAIWICSHSEEFEPRIPELNEYGTLREVSISVTFPWTLALFSCELPIMHPFQKIWHSFYLLFSL